MKLIYTLAYKDLTDLRNEKKQKEVSYCSIIQAVEYLMFEKSMYQYNELQRIIKHFLCSTIAFLYDSGETGQENLRNFPNS